ncbi:ATP-dependent DNA helicase [Trichonephila clavata]|uniref:ATP-dependent DNA helicase n=1 Tax=Trichonephila clavata TaxID=2740835 RepID=A0A8X6IK25_TRICU|nr:ATP-dependent DNA helicase [Trichonephila clavata]
MHDGFMYNPRYDYESNNLLYIGRMSNVCLKCSALKWKGETPDMCCSRTAHSAFKLPLDLTRSDSATCNISKGIGQGHVLKTCKLIVWDEATMSHRNSFHALDKTLQDLRGSSAVRGGEQLLCLLVIFDEHFPLSHVAHQQIRSIPV